ncbi:MAG: hypothetical protein JW871_02510 [Endomicrobiales bacterium]|nr:hypothetical protein [Endomicrobiales bacterium]
MIFTTEKEWEITNDFDRSILGENIRKYPLIKIDLNSEFYHVDVLIKYEEEDGPVELWHRFIMHDLNHVKSLLNEKNIVDFNIFIETKKRRKNSLERHKVLKIKEIIIGKDKDDCTVLAYILKNNKVYMNSSGVKKLDDIKDTKTIFNIDDYRRGPYVKPEIHII